jgi:hypothetical protein
MKPHEERLIAERNELLERMKKLREFIAENPIYQSLSQRERDLLSAQYNAMDQYDNILYERIQLFTPLKGHN